MRCTGRPTPARTAQPAGKREQRRRQRRTLFASSPRQFSKILAGCVLRLFGRHQLCEDTPNSGIQIRVRAIGFICLRQLPLDCRSKFHFFPSFHQLNSPMIVRYHISMVSQSVQGLHIFLDRFSERLAAILAGNDLERLKEQRIADCKYAGNDCEFHVH